MVKLGSLYRNGSSRNIRQQAPPAETLTLDRLEFNQRVQERRLLQEERKHWDRLSPNHSQLQVREHDKYIFFWFGQIFNRTILAICCSRKFSNCTSWINCCRKNRAHCKVYNVTRKIWNVHLADFVNVYRTVTVHRWSLKQPESSSTHSKGNCQGFISFLLKILRYLRCLVDVWFYFCRCFETSYIYIIIVI